MNSSQHLKIQAQANACCERLQCCTIGLDDMPPISHALLCRDLPENPWARGTILVSGETMAFILRWPGLPSTFPYSKIFLGSGLNRKITPPPPPPSGLSAGDIRGFWALNDWPDITASMASPHIHDHEALSERAVPPHQTEARPPLRLQFRAVLGDSRVSDGHSLYLAPRAHAGPRS